MNLLALVYPTFRDHVLRGRTRAKTRHQFPPNGYGGALFENRMQAMAGALALQNFRLRYRSDDNRILIWDRDQ